MAQAASKHRHPTQTYVLCAVFAARVPSAAKAHRGVENDRMVEEV